MKIDICLAYPIGTNFVMIKTSKKLYNICKYFPHILDSVFYQMK